MSKMDSVVHFEMPCDDRERVARFYRDAFGWEMKLLGPEMGDYVLATTAPEGARVVVSTGVPQQAAGVPKLRADDS